MVKERKILDTNIDLEHDISIKQFAEFIINSLEENNELKLNEDEESHRFIEQIVKASNIHFDRFNKEHNSYYYRIKLKIGKGKTFGTLRISDHILDQETWFDKNLQFGISIVISKNKKQIRNDAEIKYDIKVFEYQFNDIVTEDIAILGQKINEIIKSTAYIQPNNLIFNTSSSPEKTIVGNLEERKQIYNSIMRKISKIIKENLNI